MIGNIKEYTVETTEVDYIERNEERWIYHAKSGKEYNIAYLVSPWECECGVNYDAYVLLDCWVEGDGGPMKPIGFIYGIEGLGVDYFDLMAWCRKSVKDYETTLKGVC